MTKEGLASMHKIACQIWEWCTRIVCRYAHAYACVCVGGGLPISSSKSSSFEELLLDSNKIGADSKAKAVALCLRIGNKKHAAMCKPLFSSLFTIFFKARIMHVHLCIWWMGIPETRRD